VGAGEHQQARNRRHRGAPCVVALGVSSPPRVCPPLGAAQSAVPPCPRAAVTALRHSEAEEGGKGRDAQAVAVCLRCMWPRPAWLSWLCVLPLVRGESAGNSSHDRPVDPQRKSRAALELITSVVRDHTDEQPCRQSVLVMLGTAVLAVAAVPARLMSSRRAHSAALPLTPPPAPRCHHTYRRHCSPRHRRLATTYRVAVSAAATQLLRSLRRLRMPPVAWPHNSSCNGGRRRRGHSGRGRSRPCGAAPDTCT
jgi:hypothetical protein